MSHEVSPSWKLTKQMAAGDADAIACFYEAHFQLMYDEARRATNRDRHFCLDVVQDSMLRIIRKVRPIETQGQLEAWTRRLVCRVAYDQLRSEFRRQQREAQAVKLPNQNGEIRSPTGVEPVQAQLAWLAEELKAFDSGDLALLTARYQAGLALREISVKFGISTGAAGGRIRRLLTTLRKRYLESLTDENN